MNNRPTRPIRKTPSPIEERHLAVAICALKAIDGASQFGPTTKDRVYAAVREQRERAMERPIGLPSRVDELADFVADSGGYDRQSVRELAWEVLADNAASAIARELSDIKAEVKKRAAK